MEPEGSSPHSPRFRRLSQSWTRSIQSMPPTISVFEDPFYYYPPIYLWVFQAVAFSQVSLPKACMHLSSPLYVLHALYFSVVLISSPDWYLVRSTEHKVPCSVVLPSQREAACSPVSPRSGRYRDLQRKPSTPVSTWMKLGALPVCAVVGQARYRPIVHGWTRLLHFHSHRNVLLCLSLKSVVEMCADGASPGCGTGNIIM